MKNRREKKGTMEERQDALEFEISQNTKAIEALNKKLEPFTNTEIAVKWLSRFIIWLAGLGTSIAVIWHLFEKIRGE